MDEQNASLLLYKAIIRCFSIDTVMVIPAGLGIRVGIELRDISLRLSRSMREAFFIAIGIGILAAGFGYYLSFRFELPTGASMVALAGMFYLGALTVKRI